MHCIKRHIRHLIEQELGQPKPKVIVLVGQRRVGKTYELMQLQAENADALFFDFEDFALRELFQPNLAQLDRLIGPRNQKRLLLMDEIQHVVQIGSILKLIHDHFTNTRVVASGSAAFLLLKNIGDSLAGRCVILNVYPLTPREMLNDADNTRWAIGDYDRVLNKPLVSANLDTWLTYGCLPEVWQERDDMRKITLLRNYVNSLMLKDIFEIEGIRLPDAMQKLVRMLALQIGSEVNTNELATALHLNRRTVMEYINILEKFRLIHILGAYSNNLRNEIVRGNKIYFTDLGVRNALLGNFAPVSGRSDAGAMFENFVVNMFIHNSNMFQQTSQIYQCYFWRNKNQAEIDLVLVNLQTQRLTPIKIKLTQPAKPPRGFTDLYTDRIAAQFVVQRENVWQFV